jgi:hypothetical protein
MVGDERLQGLPVTLGLIPVEAEPGEAVPGRPEGFLAPYALGPRFLNPSRALGGYAGVVAAADHDVQFLLRGLAAG